MGLDVLVGYDLETDSCHVWTFHELKTITSSKALSVDSREAWGKLDTVRA
jgi:hypothetical protein